MTASEKKRFVAEGYGVERHPIAYNYFLIVGPESDPAGISKLAPEEALLEVMRTGPSQSGVRVWFVSRGDESGTHAREKLLWEKAGFMTTIRLGTPAAGTLSRGRAWAPSCFSPMRRRPTTLTDAGTFLAFKKRPGLDAACGKWRLSPERVLRDSSKALSGSPTPTRTWPNRLIRVSHIGGGAGPDRGPRRKRVREGAVYSHTRTRNLNERPSTSPVVPVQACHVPRSESGTGLDTGDGSPLSSTIPVSSPAWEALNLMDLVLDSILHCPQAHLYRRPGGIQHSGQDAPDRRDFHAYCDPRIHSRRKPDLLPRLPRQGSADIRDSDPL